MGRGKLPGKLAGFRLVRGTGESGSFRMFGTMVPRSHPRHRIQHAAFSGTLVTETSQFSIDRILCATELSLGAISRKDASQDGRN
jgi:hypothetical protein